MDFFDPDYPAVIQHCREYLLRESADGSDAGLCIGRQASVSAEAIAFGQAAKVRVLTQPQAHEQAAACGFYLEGLTGTHQGVIGAFSAVALHATRSDGRFLWMRGVRDLKEGAYALGDLRANTDIEAFMSIGGDEVSARNQGFRIIADYIFGANQGRASIAMTSPVAQAAVRPETIAMTAPVAQSAGKEGEWRVQFFMPARYTRETLPKPNSSRVRITELPAQRFAVLRFSGLAGRATVAGKTEELKGKVAALGWTVTGAPVTWFYDPPWTLPPMRRNEVALPISTR
jgi:hypothetical protein